MKHSVVSKDAGTPSYTFTDQDFAFIARCAQADFGLHLTDAKKDLVYSRLIKRVRHLGLTDFNQYCAKLGAENGTAERMEMLSALTTNVTHFFRESHHFQTLREVVLPPLLKAAKAGRKLRIWSAGCSAGQEPYSIAMTLLDMCPEAATLNIRILATDVDPVIVQKAKTAVYHSEELPSISEGFRKRFTQMENGANSFSIAADARALISFGELNLMQDWPIRGPFDVLMCRNVAIYFDKPTQARLWNRFADLLAPCGHLFIGHSERLGGHAVEKFEAVGVTTYRKLQVGQSSSLAAKQKGQQ